MNELVIYTEVVNVFVNERYGLIIQLIWQSLKHVLIVLTMGNNKCMVAIGEVTHELLKDIEINYRLFIYSVKYHLDSHIRYRSKATSMVIVTYVSN